MSTITGPQHISHQGWDIELSPGEEPDANEIVASALIRKHGELRCTLLRAQDDGDEPDKFDALLRMATHWVDAQWTPRHVQ